MKKLILVFVAIAISAGAFAQAGSTDSKKSPQDVKNTQNQNQQNNQQDLNKNQNQNQQNNPQDLNKNQIQNMQNNPGEKSNPDGFIMQNGKMMQVKNGKTTNIERDITLTNGTKIKSDGSCVNKDGTKMTMKEGQHMDMSGNMTPMNINRDKNMYLVPDSTVKKNK